MTTATPPNPRSRARIIRRMPEETGASDWTVVLCADLTDVPSPPPGWRRSPLRTRPDPMGFHADGRACLGPVTEMPCFRYRLEHAQCLTP